MKHIKFLFAMLLATSLFISCNSNPISSAGSIWTQGTGVSNVNHFYASGGNLLTSTYCSFCSEAYIFLSSDEGLTWRLDTAFHVDNHFDNGYLTNGIYLPAPITFISDGTTLFAGIGQVYKGDIYRSTDRGVTWSDKGITWAESDSNSEDVNCFCELNGNIFAGTDDGVFVSTDHGTTWNPDNVGIPKPTSYYHAPVSGLAAAGNSIFASTWGLGIFRSTNGGLSWTQVNTTNYQFQGLTTIGSDIFAAAFNDAGKPSTGGVFASSDNGETWVHVDADLPDHGVGVICSSGHYLFVGAETGIFASSDLGVAWTEISNGAPFSGATTELWTNGTYLFANTAGGVWRYPLFALPGFAHTTKNKFLQKQEGG